MKVLYVLTIIILGLSLWRYISIFISIDELIPSFSKKEKPFTVQLGFNRETEAEKSNRQKRKLSWRTGILVLLGIGILVPLVYLGMYLIKINS